MSVTIGIDIGGTFTDLVALDAAGRVACFTKVPSTPSDPGVAVVDGVEKILKMSGRGFHELGRVAHSSTVSLNAIIERKGAKLGILCTDGFRDILVIGRQKRTDMYDLFLDAETPLFLCPRDRVVGIPERLASSGEVVAPLDEPAVARAVDTLVNEHGVTSIAVCYLFSYLNPAHEIATRRVIAARHPGLKVSLSCEVDPQMREYERLLMTAFDAYLKPVAETYLTNLSGSLANRAKQAQLQIMQSRGGITGWRQAAARPIATVLSGPAAGVIGASRTGESAGCPNLITVDIGGTSCDISIVINGKPLMAAEGKIDRYPLRQQMVDVSCIGAGGGSIAWVDSGGALRVGPQSAGANPGPACYGRGGTRPTITDASLILGYLNPDDFGCGEMTLSVDLARSALEPVAREIGLTVPELALGMHRILNSMMADAIKLASVNRGHDPRRFALMGLGGGGPVHASALARSLGCDCAIIPQLPGVLCANGLLAADVEHEQARTFLKDVAGVGPTELEQVFDELLAVCAQRMEQDGIEPSKARISRFVDARYGGQSYDLQVEVPPGPVTRETLNHIVEAFHEEHGRVYGHAQPAQAVRLAAARGVLSYRIAEPQFGASGLDGETRDARQGERLALFDKGAGYVVTPVYDRRLLEAGVAIFGPAVLQQPDTTTIIYPGQVAAVDSDRNLIVREA